MGALFQRVCYETQSQAVDAFFTSSGPQYQAFGTSTSSQVFYYAKYTTGWYVCSESVTGTNAPTCQIATAPTFPACDFEAATSDAIRFADGATIGWGIVAAMALAYSIQLIKRAL